MKKTTDECQNMDGFMRYLGYLSQITTRMLADHQIFCARCDRWKFPYELCDEALPCETERTKDGGFKIVKLLPWPEKNT